VSDAPAASPPVPALAAPRALPPTNGEGWRRAWFASPLYRLALGGSPPRSFFAIGSAQWPGDASRGQAILTGDLVAAGVTGRLDEEPWSRPGADPLWLGALHGFGWIADLRDAGSPLGPGVAAARIEQWIERHRGWSPLAWRADILGERIVNWVRHYEYVAPGGSPAFAARFVASLAAQRKHLRRLIPGKLAGRGLLMAYRALAFADLAFLRDGRPFDRSLVATMAQLRRFLPRYVGADGVVAERSPLVQLQALIALIDLRDAMNSAQQASPLELQAAIDRMAPALRLLRHGDGKLALFNASHEGDPALIDLALARSGSLERARREAPQSGFYAVAVGQSLALIDAGSPPPRGMDREAHAGTLSFEFSVGRERLIVNCGSTPTAGEEWRMATRFTAAHSTLVIDNVNSTEITPLGAMEYRAGNVLARREESDGAVWLEASHDGYKSLFGAIHKRRIYLSADGSDLRGEDQLTGPDGKNIARPGKNFAVRFHLHPSVSASVSQGGGVLLRLPGGSGWRFRASGATVSLAESVYLGVEGQIRRTEQIVMIAALPPEGAKAKWAFQRYEG
jgi:uncharacterized heparinase superfamily protein